MTSTEHTISVLFPILFSRIVSETTASSVSESDSVRQSWIPANPSLPSFRRTKKTIRRKPLGFGFSGLFDFLFLSWLKIFFEGELVNFFVVPSRGFGFRSGLAQG
jgi:hypothetical protein